MKKKLVKLVSILCVLVIMVSMIVIPADAASYPTILDKYISYSVVEGESIELKYTIFRKYNNEKYHIDLYDSNDNKVASVSSGVYGDYMMNLSVKVDTADLGLEPGKYKAKYYMSFYSFLEWHYAPNQYTTYLTVVENKCNSNHSFGAWETFVQATCKSDGTEKRVCSVCEHFEWREVQGDHIWDEGEVTIPETCIADGEKTFKCTECSETKTEAIPAGHKWDAGKVETPATCIADGKNVFTCTVCNETRAESIPAGHKWDAGKVETPATCTAEGKKLFTCTACRETRSEVIPAGPGHEWDDGKVSVEPDYKNEGKKIYTCVKCNETKEEVVPKKELIDTTNIFKDIKAKKWYTNAINYAYSYGFIAGVSDNEFGRDVPVTRGMFITILARIAGVDTSKNANKVDTRFTDVKSGKYYTAAIKWASENGVVSGLSDTTFGPEVAIERQQLCTMIVNYAKFMNVELASAQQAIAFKDDGSIRKYAKSAVTTCQTAGIVTGYSENDGVSFKPSNTATRAEAAQILYKFHSEFANK